MSKELTKLNKNQLAMLPLLSEGLSNKEISNTIGIHPVSVSRNKSAVKQYLLTAKPLLKKGKAAAHKVFDNFLSGNDNLASQAVKLIAEQQSRIEPVRSLEHPSTGQVFVEINIGILDNRQVKDGG